MFKRQKGKKYNSNIIEIDWIKFKSKIESRFYLFFQENKIKILSLQPNYILQNKFTFENEKYREISYKSDFLIEFKNKKYLLEIKGFETPEWKIKKKLFLFKIFSWEIKKDFDEFLILKSLKEIKEKFNI